MQWINEKKDEISYKLSLDIDANYHTYEMWEFITGTEEYEIEIVNFDEVKDLISPETRGRHEGSWGLSQVPVSFEVYYYTWGQGTGYNADAKVSGALAGCPAVSIGMLCNYWWFPYTYGYMYMPYKLTTTTTSNPISKMFRDIADKIPYYVWATASNGGSGAIPADILTGLKSVGYKNAKMKTYDFTTAYNNIKARHPVLLYGYQGMISGRLYYGHVWIADGYYEQVWKCTRKFLGITTKTWYEYVDMFYMNWGWDGNGNAWVDQADWNSNYNGKYNTSRGMYYDLVPVYN